MNETQMAHSLLSRKRRSFDDGIPHRLRCDLQPHQAKSLRSNEGALPLQSKTDRMPSAEVAKALLAI
jgi:hypothetical protein